MLFVNVRWNGFRKTQICLTMLMKKKLVPVFGLQYFWETVCWDVNQTNELGSCERLVKTNILNND